MHDCDYDSYEGGGFMSPDDGLHGKNGNAVSAKGQFSLETSMFTMSANRAMSPAYGILQCVLLVMNYGESSILPFGTKQ